MEEKKEKIRPFMKKIIYSCTLEVKWTHVGEYMLESGRGRCILLTLTSSFQIGVDVLHGWVD